MHPADEIRGIKSNILSKKRVVLGVTGSIAAVECVKLARELIRHGAEVFPVMTHSATEIIHPYALEFATGNKPIIELTGQAEHVSFCGRVKNPADLLLISPCTSNTISKIAHGIDDTAVTTFATTAIGSKIPIIIVPAMHLSMYDHKIIQKNVKICKEVGIKFVDPFVDRNKAKMADIDEIVANVIRTIGKKDYANKKVLVIGGATAELIDDIRYVTNRSSGKTAVNLAKHAFFRGADVTFWYGNGTEPVPKYIKTVRFRSTNDITNIIKRLNYEIIISCAAIADYTPVKQKGKIPSGKTKLNIEMKPTKKIISLLRKNAPKSKIVGFKAEENKNKIKTKSLELLKNNQLDFVIGNTISGFNSKTNEIWIFDKKGKTFHKKGTKEELANTILDTIK